MVTDALVGRSCNPPRPLEDFPMTKPFKPHGRRAVANAPTSTASATITAERVARSIRTRFDPLPSLNPRLLSQYLQQFEYGYLEPAARTFDAMERRDDRLASVANKAKSALARYGFEVLIARVVPGTRDRSPRRNAPRPSGTRPRWTPSLRPLHRHQRRARGRDGRVFPARAPDGRRHRQTLQRPRDRLGTGRATAR